MLVARTTSISSGSSRGASHGPDSQFRGVKSPPKQLIDFLERHDAVAMATLVGVRGTSSAKVGSRMWIGPDGTAVGAVTIGGCIDVRAIELSGDVLKTGKSQLVEMPLGDEEAQALGMTCGGIVELLVERLEKDSSAAQAGMHPR